MARVTGGLYDPTMLAAIESAGYTRSFDQMIGQGSLPHKQSCKQEEQTAWRASELVGRWQAIGCRPATHEIYLPPCVGLDLGGIAKGVVAAQGVELLRPHGPCLVDAGGDLVAGAAPPGWPGWPVAIAAPAGIEAESEDLAVLWLREAALATSGIDYRRWQQQGHCAHHIIDPRTGLPAATNLLSVSVLAAKAEEAEAWAKTALILGWEAGYAALASRQLAGLLVHQDGRVAMTERLQPHLVG
jgi:FAD:protein FMN transferase